MLRIRLQFLCRYRTLDASTADVYVNIAAGTAAAAAGNYLLLVPGETWYARLALTTVGWAVHAITSTGTADCIVAALLDDVALIVSNIIII